MKTDKHYKYGVNLEGWNVFYEDYGTNPLQYWFNHRIKKGKK